MNTRCVLWPTFMSPFFHYFHKTFTYINLKKKQSIIVPKKTVHKWIHINKTGPMGYNHGTSNSKTLLFLFIRSLRGTWIRIRDAMKSYSHHDAMISYSHRDSTPVWSLNFEVSFSLPQNKHLARKWNLCLAILYPQLRTGRRPAVTLP